MNLQLLAIFIALSVTGVFLFAIFFKTSGNKARLQKYLLQKLKDEDLTEEQRKKHEMQLAKLLQESDSAGYKILAGLTLIIIPLSLYFYSLRGAPDSVNMDLTQQPTQQQMSMEEALQQLEEKLKENPDDIDGQMLYARTQYSLKNFEKAVAAYRKANELMPNESVILTELAEAIAMKNNNRSFLGEPEELFKQAYELNPDNQKALWLYGMTQYEHKNYEKTLELWSRLYDMVTDVAAKKQLAQQLNNIRSELNLPLLTDESAAKNLITATISLDESLLNKLADKNALLYIYTKATEGMPMPIAVVRQNVNSGDFPVKVNLSDLNNLQENRKLSDFKQVTLGARISFSGNAIAQKGDLKATELKLDIPTTEMIQINISSVVE